MSEVSQRRESVVIAIGVMKLVKAVGLFIIGVTSIVALPRTLAHTIQHATSWINVFSSSPAVHRAIAKVALMDVSTTTKLGCLAVAYGCVFLVEGIGLVTKKRWAEWLTVVVTGSFVPLEIYEIVKRFGVGKVATLLLNIAVVVYLAWRLRVDRRTK